MEFTPGKGKLSATLAVFFGAMALGGVICFYFPELFTSSQLRALYPISIIRLLINLFIYLGISFGIFSLMHGYRLRAPLVGLLFCLLASVLGGGHVEVKEFSDYNFSIGLDWFLLDLLILAIIFVPLERLAPLRGEQKIFRPGFKTDLMYFLFNHLFFQVLLYLSAIPAHAIEAKFGKLKLSSMPFVLELLILFFVMDFFQYWIHRSFHQVRWLWKFHAVHHSIKEVDWLAGSRLHVVDVLITRAVVFIPLHLAGFRQNVLEVYILLAAFQTVFIHANVRWKFSTLTHFIATPFYHHWHHASDEEGIDKNFAVHLPIIDKIFGTFHHPKDRWPVKYGLK